MFLFVDTKIYTGCDFGRENGTKAASTGKLLLYFQIKCEMKQKSHFFNIMFWLQASTTGMCIFSLFLAFSFSFRVQLTTFFYQNMTYKLSIYSVIFIISIFSSWTVIWHARWANSYLHMHRCCGTYKIICRHKTSN